MGRPPIAGKPQNGRLPIRHTSEERELFDFAAKVAGKPVSAWARDELLRIARDVKASVATTKKPTKKK